ncbi:topoisomerase C-terminal repeat-containing protein [Chitinivibrio alkaliphilus]|nr:topoisomerase C-terminal repeat-containing protein [Chitinivibrio alkaliphilus]
MPCPCCKGILTKKEYGWECSHCSFKIPYVYRQVRLRQDDVSALVHEGKTPWRGEWKTRRGRTCQGRLLVSKEYTLQFQGRRFPAAPCPLCGSTLYVADAYLFCEHCSFILFRKIASRTLTPNELRDLLNRRRTDILSGFLSRETGKFFSCRLCLEQDGTVRFDFE